MKLAQLGNPLLTLHGLAATMWHTSPSTHLPITHILLTFLEACLSTLSDIDIHTPTVSKLSDITPMPTVSKLPLGPATNWGEVVQ